MSNALLEDRWGNTDSWILLYEIAVKYPEKQEKFYERLNLNKSKNFYKNLLKIISHFIKVHITEDDILWQD